ncbi:MAG TPA: response regulator [Planctomycetota bacterium]|jgi:CheY-like chemotaxis protein
MQTQQNRRTVLIVDDEPDICTALELVLNSEGYCAKAVPNRDAALRILADIRPAVILLDYRMPGLDAGDFVSQVRQQQTDIAVVLMTAGQSPAEKARTLGLQHYLPKPFELETLLDMLNRCCRETVQ